MNRQTMTTNSVKRKGMETRAHRHVCCPHMVPAPPRGLEVRKFDQNWKQNTFLFCTA